MQYFDTNDPDGWLICDGVTRTATDGRYAALAAILNRILAVSTNTSNSCTPPDLKSKFLYGSSSTSSIGTIAGTTTKTIAIANLPAHNHAITDPGHNHGGSTGSHGHGVNDPGHSHYTGDNYSTYIGSGGVTTNVYRTGGESYTQNYVSNANTVVSNTTNISIQGATASISSGTTGISVQNTGSGTALDIMPPYFTVNYIMKF